MHFEILKCKQKGFLIIWILVGVLVGGAIIFTAIKLKPQPAPPPQSTVTPTPSPVDETVNWKMYTNTKDGYSIKYPNGAKLTEGGSYSSDGVFVADANRVSILVDVEKNESDQLGDLGNFIVAITTEDNKKGLVLDDFKKEFDGISEDLDIEGKRIEKGLLDGRTYITGAAGGVRGMTQIILIEKGKIYRITFEPKLSVTGDMILSTFKFTNQIDTANWKTYESKQFGFSIKYPLELGVNDEAAKNTITIEKEYKTQAEAPGWPSFMYISTIPDGFAGGPGEIYVYAPPVAKALLNMQVGETHQTFPYKRLSDITIDGVNVKIFDKLIPDKRKIERELYLDKGGNTYMIGVIISSEDSSMTLEKFNQILSTFKFLQ